VTKVNHDLRSNNGCTIYLPGEIGGDVGAENLKIPNIYEEDSAQEYPIGTRLVMGERVFHYFKAGTAMTNTNLGVVSYDCRTGDTVDSYDTAQAAGVGTVANPFKIDGTGANDPVKNAYAGHIIQIYTAISAALGRRQMKVISSSASAYDSILTTIYTVELVLDQPTPIAIAGNTDCDLFPSKYADVRSCFASDSGYLPGNMYPFVGVPMSTMTSGQWGWVQTWGPCFITHTVPDQVGDTSYWRAVVFNSDGSLEAMHQGAVSKQPAGHTLATGDGSGGEYTQLMLDP